MDAVIFDMDGVIVDSEPRHERAFREVVKQIGFANHGLKFADYVGRSDHELWLDFVARNKPPFSFEQLMQMKRDRVVQILREEQPVFEGLLELMGVLSGHFRLALASGSERPVIEAVLDIGGLRGFFSAVVSASEVARGKPAPDIFLRAAELLEVAPERCWVIEDSKPGVAAGLAAGMRVIAITNTHPADELGHASHVVNNYGDIRRLLTGA
jgi:HAD superfamily hydrolase (TIGR01509 family)